MVNYDIAYSKAIYKFFHKAFYNKINKKEYNLQIQQHNINNINRIVIEDIIVATERGRENERLLVKQNINKVAKMKVVKILNAIDFGNKYNWAISNANINIARNLKSIGIKKY